MPGSRPLKPAYNQVFAEVLRLVLGRANHEATLQIREIYSGQIPNLSSFQRAVAKEAAHRRSKSGAVVPLPDSLVESFPGTPKPDETVVPHLDLTAMRMRAELALGPEATAILFRSIPLDIQSRPEDLEARVDRHLRRLERSILGGDPSGLDPARMVGETLRRLIEATRDAEVEARLLVAAAVGCFTEASEPGGSSSALRDHSERIAWVIREFRLDLDPPSSEALIRSVPAPR